MALPPNTHELLLSLRGEFYGGPLAHADAFRILPQVVKRLDALERQSLYLRRLVDQVDQRSISLTTVDEARQMLKFQDSLGYPQSLNPPPNAR